MSRRDLPAAMTAWAGLLGADRVLDAAAAHARHGARTDASGARIGGAVVPADAAQVQALVRIAVTHRVPLHPLSTGHNWGYGTARPPVDDCVLVDLSGLDRILDFDERLGVVTLEPGVTQEALMRFLDDRGGRFLVPTTGAGPLCSIVGNALERGYGITPHADHFGALTALQAVLPDGNFYKSPLTALGADEVDRGFKWGIGPYVDGLFTQGGFGIVTQASFALARRPAALAGFYFFAGQDDALERLVDAVQDLMGRLPGVMGSVNLMNRRRVLAMTVPYDRGAVSPSSGLLPDEWVDTVGRRNQVAAWTGAGALYGEPAVLKAAAGVVKRVLRSRVDRLLVVSPARARLLRRAAGVVPGQLGLGLRRATDALNGALRILDGRPDEVAVRLAYWRSGAEPPAGRPLDPARDGCGLIWYPPLMPMRAEAVRRYVRHVDAVCRRHRIEPLITLTALSERCFDSSVPLLFDATDPASAAAARACYLDLLEEGLAQGFSPYRLGPDAMRRIADRDDVAWQWVGRLKAASDPAGILSPGRYAPLPPE